MVGCYLGRVGRGDLPDQLAHLVVVSVGSVAQSLFERVGHVVVVVVLVGASVSRGGRQRPVAAATMCAASCERATPSAPAPARLVTPADHTTMPVPLRRIAATAVRSLWSARDLVSRMPHRVHLSYVDMNRHMNYASYLEVMELGRWDWAIRSGALRGLIGTGLWPVVVKVDIDYRRELKPLQRFTLDTRLVGFDRRMMRFEQHVVVGDRIHAKAKINALLLRRGKVVDPHTVSSAGSAFVAPPLEVVGHRVVQRAA